METETKQIELETVDILEQKKKIITFEELCTEWSNYISRMGGIENISAHEDFLDSEQNRRCLDDMASCIVGEAHNGSKYYRFKTPSYCRECELFGTGFYGSPGSPYYVKDEISFENVKTLFVQHFNEVHVQ